MSSDLIRVCKYVDTTCLSQEKSLYLILFDPVLCAVFATGPSVCERM